jgi:hypothetical protein
MTGVVDPAVVAVAPTATQVVVVVQEMPSR